ncbi:MAG TPA: sodium:proton antiporter [Geobacteraceae bacterium]|nr:sodium:proton antiporter [Geobacteraceae bacterium]
METAAITSAKHILLLIGTILATGSLSGLLARKFRVPDVVFFLLVGILMGPEALGIVNVGVEPAFNQFILIFGACYILFDGGASLQLEVLKEVWLTIVTLATAGVLITAGITGLAAARILGIPVITAMLLGAVLSSTDPATLIPLFRQIKIRERVAQTVVSESAFNDAMGAIATFTLLGAALGTGKFLLVPATSVVCTNALIGVTSGAVLGYAAAFLIAHERFSFLMEYAPIVTLMTVAGAYLAAEGLNGSGFMAVFVFGIILGNKKSFGFAMKPGEKKKLDDFIATTSLIMRMFIFILLGSQANFTLIGEHLGSGILLVLVFMFIARPVTVFACALPDRRAKWSLKELLFICWTRETGVISGALAGILRGMRVPGAEVIASVTFLAILLTILAQATTTRWLAGKLGLLEEP